MLILPMLILLSTPAFLQEMAIQEYCFDSTARMNEALEKFKTIIVPSDQIKKNDHCATIISSMHRRELIQHYIRKIDSNVHISFSSEEIKRDPCKLKIERQKMLHQVTVEASGSLEKNIVVSASNKDINQSRKEVMSLQTLKDFELSVQNHTIKGTCRAITPQRYEVTLEVRQDPVHHIPPLPPGTFVNQSHHPLPKNQDVSKLMTSLQLTVGERIEIGKIVRDLKDKNSNVDIGTGASAKEISEDGTEEVFLSLE